MKTILFCITLLTISFNAQAIKVKFIVANTSVNVAEGSTGVFTAFELYPDDFENADSLNAIDFPDYVFEPTYELMPLQQLENYLTTNKHLPNMPTAEQIKKEGVDLGEINRVLVEKVEELTLYILQLNKEVEQLKVKK